MLKQPSKFHIPLKQDKVLFTIPQYGTEFRIIDTWCSMRNLSVSIILLLITASLEVDVCAQSPLPKAFGHSFQEIQDAFKSRPKTDDSAGRETLLYEAVYRYDEKGSLTRSVRVIWNVRQKALADHGTLEHQFSPWYQKQPVIEARVFDRSGKVYELAKEDSTVSSAQSNDPVVLTNDQIVRAALPGLQDGSIVEERITVEEHASYFPDGNYQTELLDSFVPTEFSSIEIDAPESLPLKLVFLGAEYPIQETRENGRVRMRIEQKRATVIDVQTLESFLPKGTYAVNQVAICVGGPWDKIAAGYSKIVDGQLDGMDFAPLLKEVIPAEVATPLEKLHTSFNWIKQNFRYTGVSLGQASIVPARPMQLLARRFGDCKDQATLLVGMLRQQGIEADVALVNSANTRYPDERAPGLNAFDHAITVATIDGKRYWLDCTNLGSTIANIPNYLQGRFVLIATAGAKSLTQIPLESPEVNSLIEDKILTLQKDRTLTTVTNEICSGMYAVGIRESAMTMTVEQNEKEVNETIKKEFPSASFKNLKQDDPWTMDGVFRRSTEFTGSTLEEIDYTSSRYVIGFDRLISELPQLYLMEPIEGRQSASRKNPAEIFTPFQRRRTYTITPVEGYELQVSEGEKKAQVGCVRFLRKSSKRDDGSIFVEIEASAEAGILSLDHLKQLYDIAKTLGDPKSDWNAIVAFREKQPAEDLARPQAIETARLHWEKEHNGKALVDYVRLLVDSGLVEEARWVAQKAVEQNSKDAEFRVAKGISAVVDLAGREFYPGMAREVAEKEFLEAKKLDPKNLNAHHYLVNLAFQDIDSLKRRTSGDYPKCLELIEECESSANDISLGMRDIQIVCLAMLDRIPEAIATAEKYQVDRLALAYRCLELAKASRWNEVKQLRDAIGADRELKANVVNIVRNHLNERQLYTASAEFIETFAFPDEKAAQEMAKVLRKKPPIEFDESPTSTPERVALELLRRMYISGSQWEWWGDIIANPKSASSYLENYSATFLSDIRTTIRTRMICREQVSGLVQQKFAVDGDDETGYRCLFKQGDVRVPIFVAKQASGYKVVLIDVSLEPLVFQIQKLSKLGKFDAAVKWMDWCMEMFPDPEFLVVESGIPAEVIWKSTRKKSPELLDQVSKMIVPWKGNVNAKYEEALRWIEAEKSRTRRILLQRYMLANLEIEKAPQYVDEAKKFLEANPAFSVSRRLLIGHLLDAGRFDEARQVFDQGKDQFSEIVCKGIEKKFNQARGDFATDLADLKKRALQANSYGEWNSFLWASIFADKLEADDVKQGAEVIRAARESLSLHTLACAEARIGMIDEAVSDLRLLLVEQGEKFRHADWLIVGFIAESCGLQEAAMRAYSKVEKDELQSSVASAHSLAQLRLRVIEDE